MLLIYYFITLRIQLNDVQYLFICELVYKKNFIVLCSMIIYETHCIYFYFYVIYYN